MRQTVAAAFEPRIDKSAGSRPVHEGTFESPLAQQPPAAAADQPGDEKERRRAAVLGQDWHGVPRAILEAVIEGDDDRLARQSGRGLRSAEHLIEPHGHEAVLPDPSDLRGKYRRG